MDKLLSKALHRAAACFECESAQMPIERWNESVFRFIFSREIACLEPTAQQLLECQRIDLVLRGSHQSAFVEFKFYIHNPSFNAYTGERLRSWKSFPSKANEAQFGACVENLRVRDKQERLRKFIVLFYADPKTTNASRYSAAYGNVEALERKYGLQCLLNLSPTCHSSKVVCSVLLLECPNTTVNADAAR